MTPELPDDALTDAQIRARKVNPVYTDGPLVRVAGGRNQAEAELIQNLLLEEGVPSLLRRSPGFDVPDFLAAGPRDVMVPQSGEEAARQLLSGTDLAPRTGAAPGPRLIVLIAVILLVGAAVALVAWLLQGGA